MQIWSVAPESTHHEVVETAAKNVSTTSESELSGLFFFLAKKTGQCALQWSDILQWKHFSLDFFMPPVKGAIVLALWAFLLFCSPYGLEVEPFSTLSAIDGAFLTMVYNCVKDRLILFIL